MIRAWLLIFLFFTFITDSFSQIRDPGLINITQQDGLPSNEAYCIFKDSKNYLWIATDQGVARMNGTSIQLFSDFPDNLIFKIREDSQGRIWFFSHSYKLAYFYNEKVYPFKFNDKLSARLNTSLVLVDALINGSNEITLDTRPFSNYKVNIDNGNISEIKYNFDKPNDNKCVLKVDQLNDSFSFAQKKISNESPFTQFIIYKIIKGDTTLYSIPCREQPRFQFQGTSTLPNGDVFLFAGRSLILLSKNGSFQIREFEKEILCIQYDKKNNCLLTGFKNGGISKFSGNDLSDIESVFLPVSMSVSSIAFDAEGGLWISTLENGLFYQKNEQITNLILGVIYRMADYNGKFLFANSSGLWQLINGNISPVFERKNEMVHDIQIDRNQNIIVAGRFDDMKYPHTFLAVKNNHPISGNSFIVSTSAELSVKKSGYFFRQGSHIKVLLEKDGSYESNQLFDKSIPESGVLFNDNKNVLWLGGTKLYTSTDDFRTYKEFKTDSAYFANGITCMRQINNGMYVLGIRSTGLAVMKANQILKIITEKDGLLSNSVRYILPDSNRLWLATAKGISVIQFSSYEPLKYTISNFGENAGLDNCIIYQMLSINGSILVATTKGIFSINNFKQLLAEKPTEIPLHFTTINYYLGDTSGINSLSIPFNNNRLVVNFDAVCFNAPKELEYFYRFANKENQDWQKLSSTQIILENLSPGDYELEIKAGLLKQNRSSSIQKLFITILKPWWQLNWIRAAAILVLVVGFFLLYKWRIKIIKNKTKEKLSLQQHMSELEQTALRSQMNPHFIFNCLTSIQQLLMTGNREEANEYLVKFSRLIRKTLELSAHPYTSIIQEKNYLTEYMELEQLRMPGHFIFSFNIDKDIDVFKTELPNMMLQPIVENCIRHGIKHLQTRKGIISIEILKERDCLKCTVADNGVGRKKIAEEKFSAHKSYGMDIVNKRLAGLPGYSHNNYFVQVTDLFDEENNAAGTKVIVQVPFKTNLT